MLLWDHVIILSKNLSLIRTKYLVEVQKMISCQKNISHKRFNFQVEFNKDF